MKALKENIRPLLLMLLIPVMSLSYLLINKFSGDAHNITISIDGYIPMIRYFIIPYIAWYVYIPAAFLLLCLNDKRSYYKYLLVYGVGCIFASLTFLLYQTTVPRTELLGNDFFTWLMQWIYTNDKPVNCLPSIHVFTCWLVLRAIPSSTLSSNRNNSIAFSLSILIILSTLFTKQHAILDVLTGALLAEVLLRLADRYEPQLLFIANKMRRTTGGTNET